jgi:hypothetical protein
MVEYHSPILEDARTTREKNEMSNEKKSIPEIWGYRDPQGQCAVFPVSPKGLREAARFLETGGTLALALPRQGEKQYGLFGWRTISLPAAED